MKKIAKIFIFSTEKKIYEIKQIVIYKLIKYIFIKLHTSIFILLTRHGYTYRLDINYKEILHNNVHYSSIKSREKTKLIALNHIYYTK